MSFWPEAGALRLFPYARARNNRNIHKKREIFLILSMLHLLRMAATGRYTLLFNILQANPET
jgi:hypothetical protein